MIEKKDLLKRYNYEIAFLSLLSVYLIIRVSFVPRFSGIDDVGYLSAVHGLVNGGTLSDITYPLFRFRVGMLYPFVWMAKAFNLSLSNYWILTLVSEIFSLSLAVIFASLRFNKLTGVFVALLWVLYPLAAYQTTFYMPANMQMFFVTFSIILLLQASVRKNKKTYYYSFFISGVSLGLGYLVKEDTAILVFIFIIAGIVTRYFSISHWIVFALGAASIFVIESSVYLYLYGDPFIRISSTMGLATTVSGSYSKIWDWTNYLKTLFLFPHKVGIYWWLLIPALISFFSYKNRDFSFLGSVLILIFLWLQFGSGSLSEYQTLPKVPRYTIILWPMMVIILAFWLQNLYQKNPKILGVLGCILISSSLLSITFLFIQGGERTRNSVKVVEVIENIDMPEIYTDFYSKRLLTLITNHEHNIKFKTLYHANFSQTDDGDHKVKMETCDLAGQYLLIDYQQSKIYTNSYGFSLPGIISNPPQNWEIIWESRAYERDKVETQFINVIKLLNEYNPIHFIKNRVENFIEDMILNDRAIIYKVPKNWTIDKNIYNNDAYLKCV